MEQKIYSVSQVTAYIQTLMDKDGMLSRLCIQGEISNYKLYPSGHHYFSLKDGTAAIRCVMFKSAAQRLREIEAGKALDAPLPASMTLKQMIAGTRAAISACL